MKPGERRSVNDRYLRKRETYIIALIVEPDERV